MPSLPVSVSVSPTSPWSVASVTGIGHEGSKLGTITVEEVYERDLAREAENVFKTTDEAHPGVAMTYREGARTIAGPISVEKLPEHIDAVKPYLLSPADTKKAFKGEIKEFTGVSDPYEAPENPALVVDTENESPEESAQKVIALVEERVGAAA